MSEKFEDGGPAFARPGFFHADGRSEHDCRPEDGMSLRDYFAGQALVGLLSHAQIDGSDFIHELGYDAAAYQSYRFADAMLKARKGEV